MGLGRFQNGRHQPITPWKGSWAAQGKNMTTPTPITTREEAAAAFLELIRQHGMEWTAKVPLEAWERLDQVNKILGHADRLALLTTGKLS